MFRRAYLNRGMLLAIGIHFSVHTCLYRICEAFQVTVVDTKVVIVRERRHGGPQTCRPPWEHMRTVAHANFYANRTAHACPVFSQVKQNDPYPRLGNYLPFIYFHICIFILLYSKCKFGLGFRFLISRHRHAGVLNIARGAGGFT